MVRLKVRKLKLMPSKEMAIKTMLQKSPAIYSIMRTEVITVNIQSGQNKVRIEPLFKGELPVFFLVGFLPNKASTGDRILNSFKFGNHDISSICASVDNHQYPREPYQPNWDSDLYSREYNELFSQLAQDCGEATFDITPEQFKESYCFFAFNLAPDIQCATFCHLSPKKISTVALEVAFSKPPNDPLSAVVFARYNGAIIIDQHKGVRCTW